MRAMRLSAWVGVAVILVLIVFTLVYINVSGNTDNPAGKLQNQAVKAGPYIVDVQLAPNPPRVEDPVTVTLTSHSGQLSGRVIAVPGLGTDGSTISAPLISDSTKQGILAGIIRLPVRGAWQIVTVLNGPQGQGSTQINIVVSAPHAIPLWFGWLLGLSPLVGVVWFFWQQNRYRRLLLATKYHSLSNS